MFGFSYVKRAEEIYCFVVTNVTVDRMDTVLFAVDMASKEIIAQANQRNFFFNMLQYCI